MGYLSGERWSISEQDLLEALESVKSTRETLANLTESMRHLIAIAGSVEEIKQCLLSAAIGKEHVPLSVVEKLLKIGGLIVFGLVGVIFFLLTGSKLGILPGVH